MEMQDRKRLYKSSTDRMIFGVGGGLADYFEIDPVIVRLVLVLLAFASGGTMVLIYIIAAIIMPTAETLHGPMPPISERVEVLSHEATEAAARTGQGFRRSSSHGTREEIRDRQRKVAGLILLFLGGVLLAANLGAFSWFSWGRWWPVALILAGLLIIVGRSRSARQ